MEKLGGRTPNEASEAWRPLRGPRDAKVWSKQSGAVQNFVLTPEIWLRHDSTSCMIKTCFLQHENGRTVSLRITGELQ